MKTSSMIASAILLGAMVMTSGCAVKTGNETLGKMEKNQIDQQIVKGKSNKQDVTAMMGDPDKTDFDNNGNEKWTYVHTRRSAKGVNYVPVVNWFVAGTNDTTKTLIVLFDDNGVVKNYIASSAEGETKGGLFQ